jgi:type II secretory pathway pseudopilin PulG
MSPRLRPNRRKGFTIIEVTMAAGVLALVLVTSVTTMQAAFTRIDGARSTTLAGQILQGEMEKLRLRDWATISAYEAGPAAVALGQPFSSEAVTASRFSVSRTVETVRTDLRKVTFTVSWRSADGRILSRSLMTYYGRNGMNDYYFNNI